MNSQLTVIIPTYNRMTSLRLCLHSLQNQTLQNFNVIVVDDGSTPDVADALEEIRLSSPLSLKVLHQDNAGPARARNLALAEVSTPFGLLIGDDILPEPDCLKAHQDFHLIHTAREEVALGWTTWNHVHQHVTPFMEWYEELQFDYGRMSAGLSLTWQHFYTSNLSFKTNLFRDHPFDERFRSAAWEDIELGFRLISASHARLTFLKDARATHIHPTTFYQATRRMRILGSNERLFHSLWPLARSSSAAGSKSKICQFLGKHLGLLDALTFITACLGSLIRPAKIHAMLLRSHHQRGYFEDGIKAER